MEYIVIGHDTLGGGSDDDEVDSFVVGHDTRGGGFAQDSDGVGYYLLDRDEVDSFVADAPESRGLEFWEAADIGDLVFALLNHRRKYRTARIIASASLWSPS